jgi:hypothetical protein
MEAIDEEFEQLIARIRARGGGQTLPKPEPEAVAAFLARTENEELMGGEELEEHERMWQAVDEEIRTIERTNESTDGPV